MCDPLYLARLFTGSPLQIAHRDHIPDQISDPLDVRGIVAQSSGQLVHRFEAARLQQRDNVGHIFWLAGDRVQGHHGHAWK